MPSNVITTVSKRSKTDVVDILRQENEKLRNQIKKRDSIEEILVNTISEVYRDSPDLKIPEFSKLPGKGSDVEIAILHYSDAQIGKVTDTYNTRVAEERLMTLIQKTIHITNVRRNSAKIEEIHLYLGGDIVEGEQIFEQQAHEIDSSVFEQSIKAGSEMIVKAILLLLKNFVRVKVLCVPGNHGRNGKYGSGGHKDTNWDNVCYATVRRILLGSPSFPRQDLDGKLTFEDNYDWYVVDRVFDWGCLIVHGDQIQGGTSGFPLNGANKKAWGWIDSIDEPWDFLFFGHFHTYASFTLNKRIVLANGTTESDNAHAQQQLAATGWPCQRLVFVNKKHGIISDNQVFLTDKRKPNKKKMEKWVALSR